MIKKLRWFLPAVLALVGTLAVAVPVGAEVEHPTSLRIETIEAFQNTREDGDQLYLIRYYVSLNTTYNAQQLFLFRLFDEDDNEIANTRPYPYNNDGFGMGVVAFYLDEAEAPDWQSGVYVKVAGNPLVDWDGDPPSATGSIITWTTGTEAEMQIAVSGAILSLANTLTTYWGVAMTTTSQGVTILTDYGANYFLQAVPYLSEVAPYCLGQYVFGPEYPENKPEAGTSWGTGFSDELEAAIDGTIFDISGPARSMGVSRGTLTATIYYGLVGLFFALLIGKLGLRKGLMMLLWPFVIGGAFFGVPLVVTILGAFLCLLATVWVFYKGSPA